jgi:hypothetical protein
MTRFKNSSPLLLLLGVIWLSFCSFLLFTIASFTKALLDPYWPFFVSQIPGLIMCVSGIFLIISIVIAVFIFFGSPFFGRTFEAVSEVAASFFFAVLTLGFSLTYGSSFYCNAQSDLLLERVVNQCRFTAESCDQFKRQFSDTDLSTVTKAYVSERTLDIGLWLYGLLFVWMVIHSVQLYCLFGRAHTKTPATK